MGTPWSNFKRDDAENDKFRKDELDRVSISAVNPDGSKISGGGGGGATTITEYNITLTNSDTEYSQALPANTKIISFRARDYKTLRFAWTTGKVAGPVSPYFTLEAGQSFSQNGLNLTGETLYLASSEAGTVVEIICWN